MSSEEETGSNEESGDEGSQGYEEDEQDFGPYTDEQSHSAVRIQGMFRSFQARRLVAVLIRDTYEKLLDDESGQYYYFNIKTGTSIWTKPSCLGTLDVLSPRSREVVRPRLITVLSQTQSPATHVPPPSADCRQ